MRVSLKDKFFLVSGIIKARLFHKRLPLFVSWSLTNRCTLSCKYCGIHDVYSKEPSTREIFSIINELKRLGTKMISFIGGEPLLREDIGEILNYCYAQNIATAIFSNGSLVINKIKDIAKTNKLRLSLDGDEKINDFLRGKGAYRKVMEALGAAKRYKIDTSLSCVLTRYNLDCVDFLVKKSKALNINIRFQPVSYVHAKDRVISALFPPLSEYKKTIKNLIIKKIKLENIENSLLSLMHFYHWPDFTPFQHCVGGDIYCRISSNGDVFLCPLENNREPLNGISSGMRGAFSHLSKFKKDALGCKGCWCAGTLELNIIYNFFNMPVKTCN